MKFGSAQFEMNRRQAGDLANHHARLLREEHAGVRTGGNHGATRYRDTARTAVIDQPAQQATRIAGRIDALALEHVSAVEGQVRSRTAKIEVVAIIGQLAD